MGDVINERIPPPKKLCKQLVKVVEAKQSEGLESPQVTSVPSRCNYFPAICSDLKLWKRGCCASAASQ